MADVPENQVNADAAPLIAPGILGGAAPADAETAVASAVPARRTKPDKGGFIWGTGRRKRSVARVRLKPGDGKIVINKKEVNDYFPRVQDQNAVVAPLNATETKGAFDIFVNVKGGGITGQAGATLLGIARALGNYDQSLLKPLRDGGYLTRDGRMVERKKPGQKKARKRFQFSKR